MASDFGNLAGGGALALLLVREVLNFLGKQKHPTAHVNRVGDLDPAEWEKRLRDVIQEETDAIVDEIKTSRKLSYNQRDIARDIAKKLGIKVSYGEGGRD